MREKFGVLDIIVYLIMFIAVVITLYPVLLMIAGSVSDPLMVIQNKVGIIPKGFNLENYRQVFQMDSIWLSYWNTIKYTVVGTGVGTIITLMTAYPLSKRRFVGRRIFNLLIMITMIFNGGLIPTFMVVKSLGWMNTIWAVTIPGCAAAWYIILARTFFESIPDSLEESAKIDGANDVTVLFKIIIPLSAPIVATLALYYAVVHWNNFFTPLIYLNDQKDYPLALLMRKLLLQGSAETSDQSLSATAIKYTCIIVTTLPIVMVYPFIQKYFVQGIMVGSIKG